jgi:hypothetical protein
MVARHRLSTPADRTVVAPNNDTLYASGWFDLRAGDLTVDVGAIDPHRYWSVMLLDAYTHVSYVCRRLHGSDGARVRVRYDRAAPPDTAAAQGVVPVGTPTVWVLARVLVDGPDDLDAARAARARIRVHQQPGDAAPRPDGPQGPPGAGEGFFVRLRDALAVDPPAAWHPPPPAGLQALLHDLPRETVLTDGIRKGRGATGTAPGRRPATQRVGHPHAGRRLRRRHCLPGRVRQGEPGRAPGGREPVVLPALRRFGGGDAALHGRRRAAGRRVLVALRVRARPVLRGQRGRPLQHRRPHARSAATRTAA